jgi:hypothetical protein
MGTKIGTREICRFQVTDGTKVFVVIETATYQWSEGTEHPFVVELGRHLRTQDLTKVVRSPDDPDEFIIQTTPDPIRARRV